MATACADNDGKTESLPFTKPEILEIESKSKVIVVKIPAADNSTVIQGKLAQGRAHKVQRELTLKSDIGLQHVSNGARRIA